MPENIALSWSSGKDAALALWRLSQGGPETVSQLLTTVSEASDRVVMHGVRPALVRAQAAAIGLPLVEVSLPPAPDNSAYEGAMGAAFGRLKAEGVTAVAYGDIFLEDLKRYREAQLTTAGLKGVFPLWGASTVALIRELVAAGIRATVACVDESKLDASFLGRTVDAEFLTDLPAGVDPCGERGEFHTFVTEAPFFGKPVAVRQGEVVRRAYPALDGGAAASFLFLDLLPSD